jgi:hypothetical protein
MRCDLCREEERFPGLGFIEERRNPIEPWQWRVAAVFVCGECSGREFFYFIGPARMMEDGYESWRNHLSMKNWFTPIHLESLQKLARLVNALPRREVPSDIKAQPGARKISPRLRARIMERDAFLCRRCGVGPQEARLVVDHIHPVSRGGTAEPDNLQTLCWECNTGKRDRRAHPHDLTLLP